MADSNPPAETMAHELDVSALLRNIWSRRWLIVAITLLFLAGAVLYVAAATPVYRASVDLIPPPPAALYGELAVADLELGDNLLNRATAYKRGLQQLRDIETRKAALLRALPSVSDGPPGAHASVGHHLADIALRDPRRKDIMSTVLSFEHSDGEVAVAVVGALVEQANGDASAILGEEIRTGMRNLLDMLDKRLVHTEALAGAAGTGACPAAEYRYADERLVDLKLRIASLRDYVGRDYPPLEMLGREREIALSKGPIAPRKLLVLALSTLGGLFLGVLCAACLAALAGRPRGGKSDT